MWVGVCAAVGLGLVLGAVLAFRGVVTPAVEGGVDIIGDDEADRFVGFGLPRRPCRGSSAGGSLVSRMGRSLPRV